MRACLCRVVSQAACSSAKHISRCSAPVRALGSSSSGRGGAAATATAAASSQQRGAGLQCRAYADPAVYDIAFNFRDFEKEAAHLLAMHQRHCKGAMKHFLEVACGPARHAALIAQSAGAAATAVDLSSAMLGYAREQAEAAGVAGSMQFVQADMTKEGWARQVEQPADLAAILLGSLAHCLDNGAALACFGELSKAVRPGGLLVLELPHPSDLWGGYCLEDEQFVEAWDAQSEDGSKTVLVEWGREGDQFNLQEQVLHRTVGLSLYAGDDLASSEVETVAQRQFTLQEVDLLARATGFEVVEVHGDFDAGICLEHEEAYRSVVCLRRKEA